MLKALSDKIRRFIDDVALVSKDINIRIKARGARAARRRLHSTIKSWKTAISFIACGYRELAPDFRANNGTHLNSWQEAGNSVFYEVAGPDIDALRVNELLLDHNEAAQTLQVRVIEQQGGASPCKP